MSGILAISHFTNWYYYIGIDVYEFIAARHGSAVDAQFHVDLALDHELDPVLRREMECRVDSLSVNPLIDAPEQEMHVATTRYAALQTETEETGLLMRRLDDQRRSEVALFGKTLAAQVTEGLLHRATFGLNNYGVRKDDDTIATLDCFRRIRYHLNSLDSILEAGTQPEIAYDKALLHASMRTSHSD